MKSKPRILVHDADARTRLFFHHLLPARQYAVLAVPDWRVAVALLQKGERFDMVFAECSIDGVEVLYAARENCAGARRVLMSDNVLDVRLAARVARFAAELIEKPIWPDDARQLIERHLRSA